MGKIQTRKQRERRHIRVRSKVSGTASSPRLAIFRSLQHIYAQVIDDTRGYTIATASSIDPELKKELNGKTKAEEAKMVGALVAKRVISQGVKQVVFDRGGYKYHGRVKALADGAREAGLKF